MLGPKILMMQMASFVNGQLYHLFSAWSQAELSSHNAVSPPKDRLNRATGLVQVNTQVIQYFSGNAIALAYKAKQEMLRPDVVVLEPLGLFLGKMQCFSGSLSKLVKTINPRHPSFLTESVNKAYNAYNACYKNQQTNEVVFPGHTCIPFIS